MRNIAGVLFASALALSAGAALTASPGGAAPASPSCKVAAGKLTFNPPLPDLSKPNKTVNPTLTAVGTVSKCSGGGVSAGRTKFTSPKSTTGANCTTLGAPDPKSKGTVGTMVITWNNKKTSTAKAFTIKQTAANPTVANTTGKITAGAFKGKNISGQIVYSLPKDGCKRGHPLKSVTYSQKKPFVIN
jgi:hypothetical protein